MEITNRPHKTNYSHTAKHVFCCLAPKTSWNTFQTAALLVITNSHKQPLLFCILHSFCRPPVYLDTPKISQRLKVGLGLQPKR